VAIIVSLIAGLFYYLRIKFNSPGQLKRKIVYDRDAGVFTAFLDRYSTALVESVPGCPTRREV